MDSGLVIHEKSQIYCEIKVAKMVSTVFRNSTMPSQKIAKNNCEIKVAKKERNLTMPGLIRRAVG